MAGQVAVSELVEDIVAFSKHKNPSVKEQTIRFLARALRNTPHALPKADVKPLSDVLLGASEDAVVPVRDAAAEGLGTLMKLVGPATFSPVLESLDDIRKAKVKEQFEKAEIKYKPGSKKGAPSASAPAKPKPAAAAPPSVGKPMMRTGSKPGQQPIDKENEPMPGSPQIKAAAKPPARLMAKKPASTAAPAAAAPSVAAVKKAPVAAGAKSAAPPAAAGARQAIEPVRYKFSQEDAEARAPEMFEGTTFVDDIGNSVWKTRLAAMDWLLEWLGNGKAAEVEPELLVRFLNKKPGPKESNFQVRD